MRDQGIPSMGKRSNHISQRSSTIYGSREERNITSEELEKEITLRIKAHRARIAEETKHLCDRNIFGDSLKVCVLCTRETCDLHQVKSEKWQRIEDKWYCGKCLKERNEPVLEKSQIDLIKKHLQDANLGYNTGDLTKNYVKDCRALLEDREELLKKIEILEKERGVSNGN